MWLFTLETGVHSFTLLQKLPQNHHSYVWTESLSSMVLMPAQKLSGIAMPETDGHTTRDSDGHTTRDWWALWDMILLVVTSPKITTSYKFFHWKFSSTQIAWKLRRTSLLQSHFFHVMKCLFSVKWPSKMAAKKT